MTKYFKRCQIELRLKLMGLRIGWNKECRPEDEDMLTKGVNALGLSFYADDMFYAGDLLCR